MARKGNKREKKADYKGAVIQFIKIFFFVLILIFIFALIDAFFHSLSPDYAVPARYFPNKIIYGTIIGVITLFVIRKMHSTAEKSLIFSAVVAVLLQIRYFLEGYPLSFVVTFLFIHFFILLVLSSLGISLFKKKLE